MRKDQARSAATTPGHNYTYTVVARRVTFYGILNTISFDEDGNIVTDGDIKSVEVYDLQGRQILTSSANGTIANNLPAGIYVIRAHTSNCASFAAKIRK